MKANKIVLKNQIKDLKRAIRKKCLDCFCCQPKKVLKCQITTCPLFEKRPIDLKGVYILVRELKKKNIGFYEAKN